MLEHQQALEYAQQATEVAPEDTLVWLRLMHVQYANGSLHGTIAAARRAVQIEPHLAVTHQDVARVLKAAEGSQQSAATAQ